MQTASVRIRYTGAHAQQRVDVVASLRAIFSVADSALDYARAKLAFDRLIDPAQDTVVVSAQIDRLQAEAERLAGPQASPEARLGAVRTTLYVSGPWNDHRPFAYDQDDPLGQRIEGKLLSTYLATRRGNCVSMPVLFLILADRLGLDVGFATAPLHVFVRYRAESGQVFNIEATSGGHLSRDAWYREQMPMTDRTVESGLYLRTLSKREGVALMATTVMEHLIERRQLDEALGVSELLLQHAPRDAYTMVKQATICGAMIAREFEANYPNPAMIPLHLRPRCAMLAKRNRTMWAAAEALGWEAVL